MMPLSRIQLDEPREGWAIATQMDQRGHPSRVDSVFCFGLAAADVDAEVERLNRDVEEYGGSVRYRRVWVSASVASEKPVG